MMRPNHSCSSILSRGIQAAPFTSAMTILVFLLVANTAQAQTFSVVHAFAGGNGGAEPYAGLTMDRAGNFYGTTLHQNFGDLNGIVYNLSHRGLGWIFTPIYVFQGAPYDSNPQARVIIGPD